MNLREQYAAARKAAQDIHDKAVAENRPKTDEERAEFDKHVAEANRLKALIDQIDADGNALGELTEGAAATVTLEDTVSLTPFARRRSAGQAVVESDEYKAMIAANPHGPADGVKPQMLPVNVGGFMNAVTVGTPTEQPLHVIAPLPLTPVDIFNEINVVEGAPDTIRIFRSTFTNNAAVVDTGDPKQQSNLVITPDVVNLEVIAHHTPVDKKTLWHNALLRNLIDTALVNGVRAKAQSEVAAELLAQVGLMQQQAFDSDYATTLRKAITKAMRGIMAIGGAPVVSVALSLEDHEALDLELLDAMVALAGQELTPTGRIWRARVVPLFGLPQGVAFVGDLMQVHFYVGQGIGVTTGWINDQFTRNQLTILAEMEAKAAVIGGGALVATDLDNVAPPNFS